MNIHVDHAAKAARMPVAYLGDGLYEMRGLPDGSLYSVTFVHDQFDIRPLSGERYIALSAKMFDMLAVCRREAVQ